MQQIWILGFRSSAVTYNDCTRQSLHPHHSLDPAMISSHLNPCTQQQAEWPISAHSSVQLKRSRRRASLPLPRHLPRWMQSCRPSSPQLEEACVSVKRCESVFSYLIFRTVDGSATASATKWLRTMTGQNAFCSLYLKSIAWPNNSRRGAQRGLWSYLVPGIL